MPKSVQAFYTVVLISHASKLMLKILQAVEARLQMYKLDLEKAEEPDQIANIHWT